MLAEHRNVTSWVLSDWKLGSNSALVLILNVKTLALLGVSSYLKNHQENQTSFAVVRSLSHVRLFETPWTAAHQASLSSTILKSLLRFMCIESMMPSNHLILCHSLLTPHPWSFPASGSFLMSWLFASGGQSIGTSASASVLPMKIQGWFSLRLTGLISLQSKGLSRVFSNTTVQKHQFFSAQLSLWSSSHICAWLLEKP